MDVKLPEGNEDAVDLVATLLFHQHFVADPAWSIHTASGALRGVESAHEYAALGYRFSRIPIR